MNIAPGKVRVVTAIRSDIAQGMAARARTLSITTSQLYDQAAQQLLEQVATQGRTERRSEAQ